jgi:hypothetical protein
MAAIVGTFDHCPAFNNALTAGFGTGFAVVHLVFVAFFLAALARLCTSLANRGHQFAVARHIRNCKPTNFCAINIERNAIRHGTYIGLVQARGRAVVAGERARVTGFDTGFVLSMGHDNSPKSMATGKPLLVIASKAPALPSC